MTPLLRPLRAAELATVLDWAAAEGWNPGLDDAAPFLAADPAGFFAAEVAGQLAAAISVVNHGPAMAFLGLYICRPDARGQGIGRALWRHALRHAGDRCIGLDGVAAQQANYARAGFVLHGATTRFGGRLAGAAHPRIRPARADDTPALLRLDAAATGHARPAFLHAWLDGAATRATLVLEGDRGPRGLATIRACRSGARIGPVIAPDDGAALDLIRAAAARMPGAPLAIDLPDTAAPLAARLRQLGLAPGFATARMYRGTPPAQDGTQHAIATMELG